MKAFDPDYKLLNEMYQDEYYPDFLVDKVKDALQKVIDLLENGETDTEVVQEKLDEVVCAINDLQEEFYENDSEIETVARDCILVLRFRLNDTDKLQANKKGIISAAMISYGGISRPFGNRKIMALCGTSSLGETQILCVSFPAHLPKLLVDDVACFCLGFLTLTGRQTGPLAAAIFGNSFSLCSFFLGLLGQAGFGLFFRCLVHGLCLLRSRHHEFMVLIIPVAIGLHEPFTQTMRHRQEGLSICHRSIILVNRLIAHLAQGMQNIYQVLRQQTLSVEGIDPLYRCIISRKRNSIIGEHQVDDGLANHPQLHQAGVGIVITVFFSQLPKVK